MDAYKTPESNLELPLQRTFKPIKALIYGLLVSVGLLLVVSAVEMAIFILVNIDAFSALTNENEVDAFFASNIYFLVIDLTVSFAILYLAGTIVRKYAIGYELKYGLILSLLTLGIHLLIYEVSGTIDAYPFWYDAAGFISIFAAVFLGARAKT